MKGAGRKKVFWQHEFIIDSLYGLLYNKNTYIVCLPECAGHKRSRCFGGAIFRHWDTNIGTLKLEGGE